MTKTEFNNVCAAKLGLSQKEMKRILTGVFDCIIENIKDEDGVAPFNGVKFTAVYKEPHVGRNPATGENVDIPGKYQAKVKFGVAVKNSINE